MQRGVVAVALRLSPRGCYVQARWQSRDAAQAVAGKTVLGFSKFAAVGGWGKSKGKSQVSADTTLCGEDSFFIEEGQMSTAGVADGVGGWRSAGIDPGEIARAIMSNCQSLAAGKYTLPHWLLAEAYWQCKYSRQVNAGSTTACIASLREVEEPKTGKVRQMVFTCNLGDSGFVLLRDHKIVNTSDPQRCSFNAPHQLAVIPKSLQNQGFIQTEPYEATNDHFEVEKGDVLVLATDGLWDNVDLDQISAISKDFTDVSEFAKQLVVAGSTRPRKPDDVTVVAARI
eukprot:TRINITY_DN24830_c0_g1_i1.p1 TRINITY_DN24830_c0_g1~~TRINITY_DN24830_c0_g1_i1.p1  ORF type:complete len:285 (+),score=108.76 TRINITY_DN24830_c0_g1_i1:58-912(+)